MPRRKASKTLMIERGQEIRRLRKEAGLTQQQLGARLGITGQQIGKYERGESELNTVTYLHLIKETRGDVHTYLLNKEFEDRLRVPEHLEPLTLEERQKWYQDRIDEYKKELTYSNIDNLLYIVRELPEEQKTNLLKVLRNEHVYNLAVTMADMPEEFTIALETAIQKSPSISVIQDSLRLILCMQRILRLAQDEIEKMLVAWDSEDNPD